MILVIVESPSKCNTIKKYLGDGYVVEASYGHIRNLPLKTMGIDVKDNFKPKYELIKAKSQQINKLKGLAKKSTKVILATDADREGHAIAWHIAKVLKLNIANTERMIFRAITKTDIHKA